jgi:copper chaperone CopZ
MSDHIVLKVAMMCSGCSGAVERVLGKMEGTIILQFYDDVSLLSFSSSSPKV